MVRFGIRRVEDYCGSSAGMARGIRARLARNGQLSYQLLRTQIPASPEEAKVFESIIQQMRLASGVYRTTYRGRFRALDALTNTLMARRFSRESPLRMCDWAASDCLTSTEWAAGLFEFFPNATVEASDLTLFLIEAELRNDGVFILEPGGAALQYIRGPFVIQLNPPERKYLLVNWLLYLHARSKFARLRDRMTPPERWLDSAEETVTAPPVRFRKLPVIHPDAAAMRARDRRFSITRHSAFTVLEQPADVIRSMNIYIRGYFPEEQLRKGVLAVWSSLKQGGWWIAGRTLRDNPPVHSASVLEKTAAGFQFVHREGEGSDIESLALDMATA